MKVITLNCFLSPWSPGRKKRLSFLIKALTGEKPDIILLQEVFFKSDANYIVKNLEKYGFIDHFYSKTLLVISRYNFISRTHKNFKNHFERNILLYVNEILNWLYGKGYQIIKVNFNNIPIVVVNTHLLSAYGLDYGSFRKARLRQLLEICGYLKKIDAKKIILGGDFNFDINSPSYQVATNDYEFDDPLREVKGNTISTDNLNRQFFLMAKMNQRLDHFFTKGLDRIRISGQIIFREPFSVGGKKLHVSDHYGLALNVQ